MNLSAGVCLLASALLISDASAGATPSKLRQMEGVTASLNRVLPGHATLDGQAVLSVKSAGFCQTTFLTSAGPVVIDWRGLENPAARILGDHEVTALTPLDHPHKLAVRRGHFPEPAGAAADRAQASIDILSDNCGSLKPTGS